MFIDSIEIYHVQMPLVYPFRTAFGDFSAIDSILVKMESGSYSGWGESSPWANPTYSPEWTRGAFFLLQEWLAPRLLGKDVQSGEQLQNELAIFKGNPFAKAALDLAWWDLHAKQLGEPLWRIIGGKWDVVEVGADFGVMETIELLLKAVENAIELGFKRVKLKFRPGWDLFMVDEVRSRFPDAVFHIDCNCAYQLKDAEMFRKLDAYHLAMIEQPLGYDDLYDHAKLQRMLNTGLCLDESITSLSKVTQAIEMGACQWINIKPGRVGGITMAIAIHNLCQDARIPVWIGGMLESAIGAAHCMALATLPNVKYPCDIFPSERFYEQDLGDPEVILAGPSIIRASSEAGIGCEPNPELLQRYLVEKVIVRNVRS